jgi:hypothetical protein
VDNTIWAERPSGEKLKNPALNIEWGTKILADDLQRSNGDIKQALYLYSGGPNWESFERYEEKYWNPLQALIARMFPGTTLAETLTVTPALPGTSPTQTTGVVVPGKGWGEIPPWAQPGYVPREVKPRLRTYGSLGHPRRGRSGGYTSTSSGGKTYPWWWWYYYNRPKLGSYNWRWD